MTKPTYQKTPQWRYNAPTMAMTVSLHESTQDKLQAQIDDALENAKAIQKLLDEQTEVLDELKKTIDTMNE
jgi:hypothetical protein